MVDSPLYIFHIVKGINNHRHQLTSSICVNDFMESYIGHFEDGKWVSDDNDFDDIIYDRQFLIDGYAPPTIVVDLIKWLDANNMWPPWMSDFDQIAIFKRYLTNFEQ